MCFFAPLCHQQCEMERSHDRYSVFGPLKKCRFEIEAKAR